MIAPAADGGLHRKLVWLTLFRLTTITVLLGGTVIVSWNEREAEGAFAPLYAIIVGAYAGTLVLALALRRRTSPAANAYAQIALDTTLAVALVTITGRSESIFLFMLSLGIVNGAILLFRRGAIAACGLAIAGYLVAVGTGGPFRGSAVFVHSSAFVLTAVLASYLSEQLRRAGERLAESERDLAAITALHEAIVQSMTSGLMTLDARGRVTFLNRAAETMSAVPAHDARGRPAAEILPAYRPGAVRDEVEIANARGERLLIGYSGFPLLGRDGETLGTAVIFQDLTRLRAMEVAVQRADRLADLGRVAAGLAHELRNPLAAMSGSLELLRGQAPAGPDDRRLMDIVLREADRLNGLVTEFLAFARPAPLRREEVDLAVVLGETLRVFANDPVAARTRVDAELGPAPVACDPGQVRQVAWNLLRNAAEALDGRGGRITVSCARADGEAVFSVADDGPGITADDQSRLFVPFFTTKERGTGLGLATVHRVVDAHGGRVEVHSEAGKGARFTVRLPARPVERPVSG